MKNLKKVPTKQLEKFSTIFTQLGLVLVLFTVYVTLEFQSEQAIISAPKHQNSQIIYMQPDEVFVFKREEVVKTQPIQNKTRKLIIDEIEKVNDKTIETVIETTKENPALLNPDDIIEVKIPDSDPFIETVPFVDIEFAPIFKGCEGLSKLDNKKCFDKKMNQFVQKNFDPQLATDIGLHSGKYKIYTQFVIDNKGNVVDIQVRAPHTKLTKETLDLIEKLPKFTPGKQRDKPVKVKYTLPISFQVD